MNLTDLRKSNLVYQYNTTSNVYIVKVVYLYYTNMLHYTTNQKTKYIHQIQSYEDVNFIVIEQDLIANYSDSYFEEIPQSDGSILLRLVKIGSNKIEGLTSCSWPDHNGTTNTSPMRRLRLDERDFFTQV